MGASWACVVPAGLRDRAIVHNAGSRSLASERMIPTAVRQRAEIPVLSASSEATDRLKQTERGSSGGLSYLGMGHDELAR